MSWGLVIGAISLGLLAGVFAWHLSPSRQMRMLLICMGLTLLHGMTRIATAPAHAGTVEALIDPPAWKLLALVVGDICIGCVMLATRVRKRVT